MSRVDFKCTKQDDKFLLRLPDGLRGEIKDASKLSGRSMNAEIISRLEASFNPGRFLATAVSQALVQHIEQEVAPRLREIAAQIGGA